MRSSTVLRALGELPVTRFLRQAWQRRPLLIRNALPGFDPPVDRALLFDLARRDDVESRLVTRFNGRWSLKHGPFSRLPSTRRSGWTVLVQGVDLHDAGARALLSRFRFIPDARLDDVMVSYASDGGGVGAHIDSYDVFLLQASGRRRWRISRQKDLHVVPDSPLKRLAGFRPDHEWILEPGDLLYLPPGVAHEGEAVGESLTYSIGFRAPTYQELLEPWVTDFAESITLNGRYADPGLIPARHPGKLPTTMVSRVHTRLMQRQPTPSDTQRFLLRHLSEPKANIVFERPRRVAAEAAWLRLAARHGVSLDRRTRLLYQRNALGINGEWMPMPKQGIQWVAAIANERALESTVIATLADTAQRLLYDWYRAGWLHLDGEPAHS